VVEGSSGVTKVCYKSVTRGVAEGSSGVTKVSHVGRQKAAVVLQKCHISAILAKLKE
jgi:hypothetical protein